jgi:hypothetical protein
LYTLEDDCGERDRSVESALADLVDGPGQHAIRVLDEEGRLSGEDAEAGGLRGRAVASSTKKKKPAGFWRA